MSLVKRFEDTIKQQNLFSPKDKLLLAVSGGIDSVVLCEICHQAGYNFIIAHCNFQLRGEDSERDELFVIKLREKYETKVVVKKFDTKKIAKEKKLSIQEAARDLRYEWFEEMRNQHDCKYVLTAHHADDNIETVLLNFFRGTGIKGVRGIEAKHDHIVRPLLFARRKELEEFLKTHRLEYVSDFTNLRDDYSRNYFRNQVIPFIEKIFPEVNENILRNISRFKEVEALYQQAINQHKKKLLEIRGNEIHIPVLKLKKASPIHSLVYEIIKDFGFTALQVNEVISLLDTDSGKYLTSSSHRIIKNRNWLIIAPGQSAESETILIEEGDNRVQIADVMLLIETTSSLKPHPIVIGTNQTAYLDAKEIVFPLLLRKWKTGDYFYPLGMKKKKKLARFFIDQKLSKTDKEKIWVLEMNKKIVWVVGHRIDERFKMTDKTKTVLKISISSP